VREERARPGSKQDLLKVEKRLLATERLALWAGRCVLLYLWNRARADVPLPRPFVHKERPR